MGNSVVKLGAGNYPGPEYAEGDQITEPYYLGEEYNFETEDPRRFDMYEDSGLFAKPLMDEALESLDAEGRARPTYPSFGEYMEVDESGRFPAFGIMTGLGKDEDTTGPGTMQPIPEYPGIEGFDIYQDLAPPQFPRRPIGKQRFEQKRGFQFGQIVRNDTVRNTLFQKAGVGGQSFSPAAMEQLDSILGRDVG
jgi:hypothetical protein